MGRSRKAKDFEGRPAKHVAVVGLGNIGSQLVPLLARLPCVRRLTLIDRDVYERKNVTGQAITRADAGKSKARVQAHRAREIRADLRVDAIHESIENVPLGKFRCDVILACLDSKIARMKVNQIAWRLGVPWIDSGVSADGLLARINVYVPSTDNPCLECAWDDRDYGTIEVAHPCQAATTAVPATNAPAFLGSLAASLQAAECHKMLLGLWESVAVNRQVLVDASTRKLVETEFRRNPRCRFDHRTWRIDRLQDRPNRLTLQDAFRQATGRRVSGNHATLRVEGKPFLTRLRCENHHTRPVFRLQGRISTQLLCCARCRQPMVASGFDLLHRLNAQSLGKKQLDRTLASVGFRPGDVFIVGDAKGERYFEVHND